MRELSIRRFDQKFLEKEPNTFEIRDMKNKLICTSCQEYQDNNMSSGLEKGQVATFYFVGLAEHMYFKDSKQPCTCNVHGDVPWSVMDFLKSKGFSVSGAMNLYYRLCEDCINELEAIAEGKTPYKRTSGTECDFCIEVCKIDMKRSGVINFKLDKKK
jgi:hypothetical protein